MVVKWSFMEFTTIVYETDVTYAGMAACLKIWWGNSLFIGNVVSIGLPGLLKFGGAPLPPLRFRHPWIWQYHNPGDIRGKVCRLV